MPGTDVGYGATRCGGTGESRTRPPTSARRGGMRSRRLLGTPLRAFYAISGTDSSHGTTRYTHLRTRCAIPSTDWLCAYARSMQSPVLMSRTVVPERRYATQMLRRRYQQREQVPLLTMSLRARYSMPGTDLARRGVASAVLGEEPRAHSVENDGGGGGEQQEEGGGGQDGGGGEEEGGGEAEERGGGEEEEGGGEEEERGGGEEAKGGGEEEERGGGEEAKGGGEEASGGGGEAEEEGGGQEGKEGGGGRGRGEGGRDRGS
eukprot:3030329-Rhodomonas_salina.6